MTRNLASQHHADRVMAVLRMPAPASGIEVSWRRCLLNHHLDPERTDPPMVLSGFELRQACGQAGRLLRVADPELDRLHGLVHAVGYSVLMTDPCGAVLARRVLHSDEGGARHWRLWTGALWSEAVEGTNGVGTCLAEQHPVTVHRDQHFRRRHTSLTCTVAPLFDAAGQLAGALDVSSFRPDAEGRILPLAMAAVRGAARHIEKACFHESFPNCLILTLPEPEEGHSVPLLALDADRRLIGATKAARELLHLDDATLVRSIGLGDLLGDREPVPCSFVDAERAVLVGALAQNQGNVTAAASFLGISRATLHRKLRKARLNRSRVPA